MAALSLSYLKCSDTFPIKIRIKHCKLLKHFSSTGKKSNFWYRESRGFPLGRMAGPSYPTQASSGSLVSSSVVLAHTQPYFVCLLSVLLLIFSSPFISEEHAFSLADLLSPNEWLPTPTHAFYLFLPE